jgi:phosphatidylserine/phosphatidylglycerophosphate/cardiolipin synthase-like enzyme
VPALLRSVSAVAVICLGLAFTVPGAPARAASAGTLHLIVEPEAGMAPIDQLFRSAQRRVDLEIYELADPVVESILAADATRGVRVRVLLDKAGVEAENATAFAWLGAHGVAVRWAPSRFDVDHEKAAVIDDSTALVMTMNLTARYYATTRDVVVDDTEPADVAAIETTFDDDWGTGAAFLAPGGDDLLWSPGSEQAIIGLIDSARIAIDVENEEMGDARVTDALVGAAHRGVRVLVVMTEDPAWRRALDSLAAAGVEVRTYPDTPTALYIHAKIVAVDPGHAGARAFVGSENFSVASLLYNRELGIVTSRPAIVGALARLVVADAAGAEVWK